MLYEQAGAEGVRSLTPTHPEPPPLLPRTLIPKASSASVFTPDFGQMGCTLRQNVVCFLQQENLLHALALFPATMSSYVLHVTSPTTTSAGKKNLVHKRLVGLHKGAFKSKVCRRALGSSRLGWGFLTGLVTDWPLSTGLSLFSSPSGSCGPVGREGGGIQGQRRWLGRSSFWRPNAPDGWGAVANHLVQHATRAGGVRQSLGIRTLHPPCNLPDIVTVPPLGVGKCTTKP